MAVRRALFPAIVSICVTLASASAVADTLEQWLLRMDQAVSSLSYRGTLIRATDNHLDTLRVIHRVGESGDVRERIHALDGPPREVIRDGGRVRCLISGQASLVVDNPFPARLLPRVPLNDILGPESPYTVRAAGAGRVAGRDARIFEILPTDRYRYGRRLWLDEATAMLLRSMLFDERGQVVENLSFVQVELGATISDQELEAGLENPERVAHYRIAEDGIERDDPAQSPKWVPESLPAGFRLASVGRGNGRNAFEHVVFSDGLASFSVYVESQTAEPVTERVESRGAMHIYTGSVEERPVTVVGEVPASTVRMIGRHLQRSVDSSPRLLP